MFNSVVSFSIILTYSCSFLGIKDKISELSSAEILFFCSKILYKKFLFSVCDNSSRLSFPRNSINASANFISVPVAFFATNSLKYCINCLSNSLASAGSVIKPDLIKLAMPSCGKLISLSKINLSINLIRCFISST